MTDTASREVHRRAEARYREAHRDEINAKVRARREEAKVICVYLVYDQGECVYVGRTDQIMRRMEGHRQQSEWWNDRFSVATIRCKSYGDSLVTEAVYISDLQPRFNKDGVTQ